MLQTPVQFSRALEDQYVNVRLADTLELSRGLTAVSAPFILILIFHDNLVDPGSMARTWPFRVGAAIGFVILTIIARRARTVVGLESVAIAGFVMLSITIGFVAGEVENGFIWDAPGFILSLGLIGQAIRRGQAFRVMAVLGGVPIIMYIVGGATSTETISLAVFLVTGLAFSYLSFARIDSTNRRVFVVERELEAERDRVDQLVRQMVPGPIAERLKGGETSISDHYDDITVLFADVVGFTRFAEQNDPQRVVGLLNELFTRFDSLVAETGLEKIKTIGDGYMVAGGVPEASQNHASDIVDLAIDMCRATDQFGEDMGVEWRVRVGISSGPVVAGVIGSERYAFDIWGDTVNVASRLESNGEVDDIRISRSTADQLGDGFDLERLGLVEMKNREPVEAFRVLYDRASSSQ